MYCFLYFSKQYYRLDEQKPDFPSIFQVSILSWGFVFQNIKPLELP